MEKQRECLQKAMLTLKVVAMYDLDDDANNILKVLSKFWKYLITFTTLLSVIQSILYIFTREEYDLADLAGPILNIGIDLLQYMFLRNVN